MAETATRTRRSALPVLPAAPSAAVASATHLRTADETAAARIAVITLGCDKNTVDTERILARLHGGGGCVVEAGHDADVLVVNTCGFIDVAKEESIETILEAVRMKQDGRVRAVVAMGCLVQRYRDELEREIPEVDLFLRLTEAERLLPELRARGLLPDASAVSTMERPLRMLSTRTSHTSYLKISEGCDHTCAFCAIPLMRGRHRSTPIELLVREAAELEAAGIVELNIVSQDTTWYGRDFLRGGDTRAEDYFVGKPFSGMVGIGATKPGLANGRGDASRPRAAAGRPDAVGTPSRSPSRSPSPPAASGLLPDLLQALTSATSIPWLRLFYMYPSGITRELVELIAREPRILPYLDMPIQHGSDDVLRLMRRPERRATILERVRWLRDAIPDLTLRTTVIVGFPGETEDDFDAMLELLEEVRFDRLGAFSYSIEENTPAAMMGGHVPDALKRERLERLLDLQRSITLERNEAWAGREVGVLVDSVVGRDPSDAVEDEPLGAVARTAGQALEVDGVVHIADAGSARPGHFIRVRITEALEDDLVAERVRARE
jgi:ribosomal protein S12 methylthiotransferase